MHIVHRTYGTAQKPLLRYSEEMSDVLLCLEVTPLNSSTVYKFWCSNNESIDRHQVCDLHKDCPEGEDEEQDCGECYN